MALIHDVKEILQSAHDDPSEPPPTTYRGHDDPSEPPPTVYPGTWQAQDQGINAAQMVPMPMQAGMVVVSGMPGQPMPPPGCFTMDGMMFVPAGMPMQTSKDGPPLEPPNHWPWGQGNWMMGGDVPPPPPWQAEYPQQWVSKKQQRPKQRRRARSHDNVATLEATRANTVEWPQLHPAEKTDEAAKMRCPPGSIWRDCNPGAQWNGARGSAETKAAPPAPARPKMCSVEIQCDLLSIESTVVKSVQQESATCKHCGVAPDAQIGSVRSKPQIKQGKFPSNGRPEVPVFPELAAWGPANDWAWDHDSQNDDTDPYIESEYLSSRRADEIIERKLPQLPPAPLTPPPMPPQKPKDAQAQAGKAKTPVGSCPATPATTAGSYGFSVESSPCGGAPGADFAIKKTPSTDIELPASAVSCSERLQQRLARLRKRRREVERLEERIAQGGMLNADQSSKIARLGPLVCLQAKMERLEARIARAADGCEVSDSDSSEDASMPPSRTQSVPQEQQAPQTVQQTSSKAPKTLGSTPERVQTQTATKPSTEPRQRRQAATPKAGKIAQPRKPDTSASSNLSCRRVAPGVFAIVMIAGAWATFSFCPELVQDLTLNANELIERLYPTIQEVVEKTDVVEYRMLPAGSSNAWATAMPTDPSQWPPGRGGPPTVKMVMKSVEVEVARAGATARQVSTNVATIRQKLDTERESRRMKQEAKRQKALRDANPELAEKYRQEQMQRWWAHQQRQEQMARYEWQKQQWEMQNGGPPRDIREQQAAQAAMAAQQQQQQQHQNQQQQQQQ